MVVYLYVRIVLIDFFGDILKLFAFMYFTCMLGIRLGNFEGGGMHMGLRV